ncbi:MAG: GNAT family N-acetyltransferase [Chloroflexi bacterium]|nr:GNAT family N-acetyltransferase [Chloroflexota bacterium]
MTLPPKQLRMVIDKEAVCQLPDIVLPIGYSSRPYRSGDVASWADSLRQGGFTDWTETRVAEYLKNTERKEGSGLVEFGGRIVAATFASRLGNQPHNPGNVVAEPSNIGILDFVVTHPEHRGRGLGKATCTAVAKFLVARGCTTIELGTDDWRLPAIHVYLSMGFQPVINRNDMPGRWAAVIEKLKESGRDHT